MARCETELTKRVGEIKARHLCRTFTLRISKKKLKEFQEEVVSFHKVLEEQVHRTRASLGFNGRHVTAIVGVMPGSIAELPCVYTSERGLGGQVARHCRYDLS